MDLDPIQVFLFLILLNLSVIPADDFDFRRNLIRTRLRPSVAKKELRGGSEPSSEGKSEQEYQIIENRSFHDRNEESQGQETETARQGRGNQTALSSPGLPLLPSVI